MYNLFFSMWIALRSCFRTRMALQLEILALRHQVNVLRRSQRGRIHLNSGDRFLWAWIFHLWSGWRSVLLMVRPETVIGWHRQGFRLYWRWKSRPGKVGRPALDPTLRGLIRKMSKANPLWGG